MKNTRLKPETGAKHTPGKWEIRQAVNSPSKVIYTGPEKDNRKIATVHGFDQDGVPKMTERVEANARLIASAPELFSRLHELVHYMDVCGLAATKEGTEYGVVADAREALAKATQD